MLAYFFVGGLIGILIGWWAKGTSSPASSGESDSGQQSLRASLREAVKIVGLVALATVVLIVVARAVANG